MFKAINRFLALFAIGLVMAFSLASPLRAQTSLNFIPQCAADPSCASTLGLQASTASAAASGGSGGGFLTWLAPAAGTAAGGYTAYEYGEGFFDILAGNIPGTPDFTGGQEPGVLYQVNLLISRTQFGQPSTQTAGRQVVGPVVDAYIEEASGDVYIQHGQGDITYVTGEPTQTQFTDVEILSTSRVDGQPDTFGNPSADPLTPADIAGLGADGVGAAIGAMSPADWATVEAAAAAAGASPTSSPRYPGAVLPGAVAVPNAQGGVDVYPNGAEIDAQGNVVPAGTLTPEQMAAAQAAGAAQAGQDSAQQLEGVRQGIDDLNENLTLTQPAVPSSSCAGWGYAVCTLSGKFPFDVIGTLPAQLPEPPCPSFSFFGQSAEFCFLKTLLGLVKWVVAAGITTRAILEL